MIIRIPWLLEVLLVIAAVTTTSGEWHNYNWYDVINEQISDNIRHKGHNDIASIVTLRGNHVDTETF